MALTDADKNYLEKTFVKKEELAETNDNARRFELIMEHRLEELRGILGDILDYVKEIPVQRQRLDDHHMQIRQLNRTVYGGEASSE